MEKMVNFKRVEVSGVTKEEALAQAPFNVNLPGADCTAALRNLKKKMVGKAFTDADMKQFMADQLKAKTKNSAGNGCYVVLEPASKDTRKRPYEYKSLKGEGSRKWKTFHVWRDAETGVEICSVDTTKADAAAAAKKLISDKKYTGHAKCHLEKRVVEGSPIEAEIWYTPSKSASVGRYLCWGIESI